LTADGAADSLPGDDEPLLDVFREPGIAAKIHKIK
jgi:hypothetical protein